MPNTKNPFTGMLDVMGRAGKPITPGNIVGSVYSTSPLQVMAGGILLDAADLFISDVLAAGYARSATHGEESGTITFGAGLAKDDIVLLLPVSGGQQFVITSVIKAVT